MNNKGQSKGTISLIIAGIVGLVFLLVIALVVMSTIRTSNLLTAGRTTTTVTNQSGGWINGTPFTLTNVGLGDFVAGTFSISKAHNATSGNGSLINATNYTVSSTGIVTNTSVITTANSYSSVNFSYSYTTKTAEEFATDKLTGNFSSGTDNISSKIPTVMLLSAIILLVIVFVVLYKYKDEGFGKGNI